MPSPIAFDVVFPWDKALFGQVNALARATAWLHPPMLAYATYGIALFAVLLLCGWWVARASGDLVRVTAALWAPLGALAALAINQPLVGSFREPRPYTVLPHALVLAHRSTDYSFPSDHAVVAGAVTAGLFLVSRRLGAVAAAAAVLMAFARVYVGAHFPGDVLVGLLVGAVVSVGGFKALQRPGVAIVAFLVGTPLRPLLVAGDTSVDPTGSPLPDHRPTPADL